MTEAIATPQPKRPTLYGLYDDLQTILDTIEGLEGQEGAEKDIAELEAQATALLQQSAEKVDAFVGHLKRCEVEQQFLKARKAELDGWIEWWERRVERLKKYARQVIESLPRDGKGKYQKLQGRESQISLREPAGQVKADDIDALPEEFVTITLTLPLDTAHRLIQSVAAERPDIHPKLSDAFVKAKYAVDKRAIAAAIKGGYDVPGAELTYGEPAVIVK